MSLDGRRSAILGSHGPKGLWPLVGVGVFLGTWWFVARVGWVSALILPSPVDVLTGLAGIGTDLFFHFSFTAARVSVGFAGGILVGSTVGLYMQYSPRAYALLDGLVESWRPIPPVALIPFFVLIFGFSELGRFLVTVLGTGLVAVVTVTEALERVKPALPRFGLVCGLSRRELFRRILIPASIPHLRGGFRVALALSVTLVIVSEFLGARWGLGHIISTARVTLNTPVLLGAVFLLGVLGYSIDWGLRRFFVRLTPWCNELRETLR